MFLRYILFQYLSHKAFDLFAHGISYLIYSIRYYHDDDIANILKKKYYDAKDSSYSEILNKSENFIDSLYETTAIHRIIGRNEFDGYVQYGSYCLENVDHAAGVVYDKLSNFANDILESDTSYQIQSYAREYIYRSQIFVGVSNFINYHIDSFYNTKYKITEKNSLHKYVSNITEDVEGDVLYYLYSEIPLSIVLATAMKHSAIVSSAISIGAVLSRIYNANKNGETFGDLGNIKSIASHTAFCFLGLKFADYVGNFSSMIPDYLIGNTLFSSSDIAYMNEIESGYLLGNFFVSGHNAIHGIELLGSIRDAFTLDIEELSEIYGESYKSHIDYLSEEILALPSGDEIASADTDLN